MGTILYRSYYGDLISTIETTLWRPNFGDLIYIMETMRRRRITSSFEGYPIQVRHKQDWGRGFILLLPQTAALPESDAGTDVIKPASSFVIQKRQISCSMWCPMYRARC